MFTVSGGLVKIYRSAMNSIQDVQTNTRRILQQENPCLETNKNKIGIQKMITASNEGSVPLRLGCTCNEVGALCILQVLACFCLYSV